MDRRRKARSMKRPRQEIAVADFETDALPGIGIEIGMRGREGLRFGSRPLAKAVELLMAG